jgi:hypothetical protein
VTRERALAATRGDLRLLCVRISFSVWISVWITDVQGVLGTVYVFIGERALEATRGHLRPLRVHSAVRIKDVIKDVLGTVYFVTGINDVLFTCS